MKDAETKKILVAIDFGVQSKKTFRYASALAGKTGAKLIVLSVLNIRDIQAALVYSRLVGTSEAVNPDKFTEKEIERRKKKVDEGLEMFGLSDIEKEIIIKVGLPYEEILKAIKEFDIDLVVMGTKGETKHDEYSMLIGSVAERVLKHSPVPVLSVRGE